MTDVENSIQAKKQYQEELTAYTNELRARSDKDKLAYFAEFRKFPIETVEQCGIFYVNEMTDMLLPKFFDQVGSFGVISNTNHQPIFHNRWVIPIYDSDGLVKNLVGYSPDADERYVYGTAKYYRRIDDLWGLENLWLAYSMGYAIITEGITDAIRLRSMGYKNAFAMCGTHKVKFIMRQLNRCRHGIIRVPDRDKPGQNALKDWECNRHITLNINFQYKDVDEMCRQSDENREWFNDYMRDCINWITKECHNGQKCICETVTIL